MPYAAFLPALLPAYYLRLGLDEASLASLVAIFAISASLPGPLLGLLADRIGARSVAAGSVALSALLMSLLTVAPDPALLYALTAAAGLGSAAIHPSGSTLVRRGRVTPELAVALFSAAGMLGYAAGPMFLGAARSMAGDMMLLVLVAPGLLAAVAVLVFLPREVAAPPALAGPAPRYDLSLIAGPVGLLTLAAAFAFLPATAMLNGLPLLLAERHGLDPADPILGRTISLYSLASALGGIGVGLLVLRIGRRLLLGAVLVGSVPASLSVLFVAPGDAAYLATLALAGMLGYASTPLLVVAVQDLSPRSAATGAGMVFGLAAALTGTFYLGLGAIQTHIGAETALALAFLGPLVATPLALPMLARADAPAATPEETPLVDALLACACASGTGTLPR
jgi:MFS transporter, FSR family, fosmidomycin resistance protein